MDEGIEKKVEAAKPGKRFLNGALLYAAAIGVIGGWVQVCDSAYHAFRRDYCVTMTREDFADFSDMMNTYKEAKRQYLCEIARQARNYVDKNHNGFVTREEAGLLPKGK